MSTAAVGSAPSPGGHAHALTEGADCESAHVCPRMRFKRMRRQGMRMSLWEGFFSHAHLALTGPHFLTGYLLMLGATDIILGIVGSIQHFLQVFQIVSAYVTTHVGSRRTICCGGVILYRGIYLVLAFLPFIPGLTWHERMWAVVAMLMLSNLALMFVANSWSVWMADLVPLRIRGRYFGMRSGLALVYNTIWSLGGGALLDHYRTRGGESVGFAMLFVVACVFALIGLVILTRQWEPPFRRELHPSASKLATIFQSPNFRRACTYLFIWNFGQGLSAAFYSKYMLANLQMSFQMVMLYPVVVNLTGFACSRAWGRFMDTVGTRSTALVCSGVTAFLPLLWWFAHPGVLWPIWVDAVATGIFWTGLTIATQNLPLVVTPDEHKMHYVGVFTTVCGLSMGIGSLFSGKLATMLADVHLRVPLLDHSIVNYQIIFGISVGFRLVSLLWLYNMRERNVRSVRTHLWNLGRRALLLPAGTR